MAKEQEPNQAGALVSIKGYLRKSERGWSVQRQTVYKGGGLRSRSPSLVLGHVLSPVRLIPRHSLLLIANYTSEPVC